MGEDRLRATPVEDANPWLSVVIPCFNQGAYVATAIRSVLTAGVEVIVVNDGSTDETKSVVAAFGSQVSQIVQANAGLSAARNVGIEAAVGEFLLFLDADDYVLDGSLEKLAKASEGNPTADVLFGNWTVVDQDGTPTSTVRPEVTPGEDMLHRYLKGNVFPCHSAIFRRRLLQPPWFDENLRSFEDWDCWLRVAAARARFEYLDDALVAYRQHPGSMSKHFPTMQRNGILVLHRARALQHPGCATCRSALAEGRRSLRYFLYVNLLRPRLRSAVRGRELVATLSMVAAAVRADPGLLALIPKLWLLDRRTARSR